MSVSFVQSVWTVMAMVVFIGIVIWAYSRRKKADFEKAGRIAMDDDKPVTDSMNKAATNTGSKLTEE
jgi:cytochrome c oxidase cbb3-type subunit 4